MLDNQTKVTQLTKQQRDWISYEILVQSDEGKFWLDKLRRFASFHGRHLCFVSKKRVKDDVEVFLIWLTEILLSAVESTGDGDSFIDAAVLNGALYCVDAIEEIKSSHRKRIRQSVIGHVNKLRNDLMELTQCAVNIKALGGEFNYMRGRWSKEVASSRGVVIFCPNDYSLYTRVMLHICKALKLPVLAVVVRSFGVKRFYEEFYRDGSKLLRKIWRKLILRADENPDKSNTSIFMLYKLLEVSSHIVTKFAKHNGIEVIRCSKFEDAEDRLLQLKPGVGIFTGGGILRKDTIEAFEFGIINIHMGLLPKYKGMDVAQAPILEREFGSVGLAAHLMDDGIDTGPIIQHFQICSDQYSTIGALRNEMSSLMPIMAIDSALGLMSERLKPVVQPNLGRQYYFLHEELERVLGVIMNERFSGEFQGTLVSVEVDKFLSDTESV